MNRSNDAQKRILLLGALVFVGGVVYMKTLSRSVRKDMARMQTLEERDSRTLNGAAFTEKVEKDRRLLQAVSQDDAPQIALLLKQGIRGSTIVNSQPICNTVAGKGAVRIMSLLLAQGTDVNVHDHNGNTLLMEASGNGQSAMVDFLLAHGADVTATDKIGETALHRAASHSSNTETLKDHLTVMQKLVQKGANVNARTSFGSTPLMEAARYSKPEVIDFLLAHGADVNAIDKNKNAVLNWAADRNQMSARNDTAEMDQFAIMQKLFKQGVSVKHYSYDVAMVLRAAISNSNVEMLRLLLAHGGDPNEFIEPDCSLLHYARKFKDSKGNAEIIQTLIQAGAKE